MGGALGAAPAPRAAFATPERLPEAEEIVVGWPDEALARLGIDRATYIAILTHDPKLDDAALRIALRSDAAYVGAMGSRRAQVRRRERLLEAGMSDKELDRLAAPIGLDLDEPRGDGPFDHGRGRRGAQRPRRRPAQPGRRADPRGRGLIGGLVLAAGEGRRFGGTKLAAELDGVSLLEHAVGAVLAVPAIERIVVVLGAAAAEVAASANLAEVETVVCDRWREGISASLRAGVRALAETEAIVVMLGDQPFITPQVIAAIADQVDAPAPAARATYAGRPGHPVLIKRELFGAIEGLRGDAGARDLLAASGVRELECAHLCRPDDIDTPADLDLARRQIARAR